MRNRPQRNNNPLNLRYARQRDASGADEDGYAVFPTPETGWRAGIAQIKLDTKRGLMLREFIEKFAPPTENDTFKYIKFITDHLNVGPFMSLTNISPYALAGIMAQMEGYFAKTKDL